MDQSDLFRVALSMIPNVGPITTRKLVSYVGGVEAVFQEKKALLKKVPGIGDSILSKINRDVILKQAEEELNYLLSKGHSWLFYLDKEYPSRLKECEDAPVILYFKGKNLFNTRKVVSIVGTRKSTDTGQQNCEGLVYELSGMFPEILFVSGFAYGIDICAHKAALEAGRNTIAVLGNGIDIVYPALHRKYVNKVLESGTFVSEFPSRNKPEPGNFVSRNRIIAGLADATVVIESGKKGGALITADMANSYFRDVFAFPGRVTDAYSAGCNNLIKQNKAALIESAGDLVSFLRWDADTVTKPVQQVLFEELNQGERELLEALKEHQEIELDQLARNIKLPVAKVSATLLTLEFKGLVKALPGKTFKAV